MNIKARLGLDVFKIDQEPHIIINQEICQTECQVRYCLHVCPAELYTLTLASSAEPNKQDQVQVEYEGCLECGTCLIACRHEALTWHYPRAGFGVQYRFG